MAFCKDVAAFLAELSPYSIEVDYCGGRKRVTHTAWSIREALEWADSYGAIEADIQLVKWGRLIAYRFNIGASAPQSGFLTWKS